MPVTPINLAVTNITPTSARFGWTTPLRALISALFGAGEQGAFYIPKPVVNGAQALFQDAAGTVPVTADGDPDGSMSDQSPNGHTAVQTISSRRPTYNATPDRLSLDKVDDALIITVPAGGFVGTMVLATDKGTASYEISIDAGAYDLGGQRFPGDAIVGAVFRNGAMTDKEKADTESFFVSNGATASYGAVRDFSGYWRDRDELTGLPLIDTSSGTDFSFSWFGCANLETFPLIDTSSGTNFSFSWFDLASLTSFPIIDTSQGVLFRGTWRQCRLLTSFPFLNVSNGISFFRAWSQCNLLTSFPENFFDNIQGGNLEEAFEGTTLNQASIDNILVSLVTSGIDSGTRVFDQSGGSAPSSTGEAAIDTLRSRGWTVAVTGGY